MTLRNAEFRITFSSKADRFYYYFAKDGGGWYQITTDLSCLRGRSKGRRKDGRGTAGASGR
jgi:hypothetical protein